MKPKLKVLAGSILIGRLYKESASRLIQFVGRMQFLVVAGLRVPRSRWLSARGASQLPEDTCISRLVAQTAIFQS